MAIVITKKRDLGKEIDKLGVTIDELEDFIATRLSRYDEEIVDLRMRVHALCLQLKKKKVL
jgi:hypothetical protein